VNLYSIVLYIILKKRGNDTGIYFCGEIIHMFITMSIRCTVIAIKYSTYDPWLIRKIKNKILTYAEISQNFILNAWRE
jgi:hypothetical protein